MATNPLRKKLTQKYGGAEPEPVTEDASTSRSELAEKYGQAPPSPVITEGKALEPTRVTEAPKKKDLRASLVQKYAEPTKVSRRGREFAKQQEEKIKIQGTIASPEFYATSVDVRSERGEFKKTFKSETQGEAKRLAEEYAEEIGGFIQVTPRGGALGKMFVRAQEAFKGALEHYGEKGAEFIDVLDVSDPESTPIKRAAKGTELGIAGITTLLAPISAAFTAGEELPGVGLGFKGVNLIFEAVDEGGRKVARKTVQALPVSDKTKEDITKAAEDVFALTGQIVTGHLSVKGTQFAVRRTEAQRAKIKELITKDIIEQNQLPRNVYISGEKVADVFGRREKISPEEHQLIVDLGLDAKGWVEAKRNGINIEIPAEKIIQIVDKPYFAKIKEAFNIEPYSQRIVDAQGKPRKGPEMREERLIEGRVGEVPKAPKTAVEDVYTSPITPRLLDRIETLTPIENTAFGKKIVESINEAIGTKIPEGAARLLPSNVDLIAKKSGDGRPAQFKNGRIELFLPDLMGDLKTLSEGKTIMAHEGIHTTVYKKKEGESMEDLSVRYVRDIVLHEAGHEKTMTLKDSETIRGLQRDLNAAKLSQDKQKVIDTRKQLTDFMGELENKANAYVRDNLEALEKEFFGGKRETATEIQRRISKVVSKKIPAREKIVTTEKKVLVEKIKARAKGAREAAVAERAKAKEKVKEVSTRYREIIDKINDRKYSRLQKQSALVDYAQLLPYRERGKFLKAIRNTITQKEFLAVLKRMQEASKTVERKNMITEIMKELKGASVKIKAGKPSAKLSADKQRVIDDIKKKQLSYEFKAKELRKYGEKEATAYGLAQSEIANKISEFQTANPDKVLPTDLLHELQILRTVGLKDMTVQELSSVLSDIKSIIEEGKTKRELDRFNLETERQQFKDAGLDVITGGKELPSKKMGIKQEQVAEGYVNKLVENMTTGKMYLIDAWEEMLDSISKFDKESAPYESVISKKGREVKEARVNEYLGNKKMIDKINQAFLDIYKVDEHQLLKILADQRDLVDLGELKLSDGTKKHFKVSRGQAIKYKGWFRDERLDSTFEKAGWTPEIREKIESVLTKEDKVMADWFIDTFYREYYDRINPTHIKDTGVDLAFSENYSPAFRDVEVTIPENVLLAKESAKYATARTGSLKQRVDNTLDLVPSDAFGDAIRHVTKMEHYIAWQENLNDMRSFFGNKDIRNSIREFHGKARLKFIDEALNDYARGGVAKEKIVSVVDKLRINTTKAILGLNWKVATKQISGLSNYWIELDTVDFFAGVGDFWKDPIKNGKFLFDESGVLAERYATGWERDIKAAMEKGYDKKIAKAENFDEILFILIRNMDKFTVMQGAHAAYKAGLKKGMNKEDAIKYAEDITERTQEASALDTLSPAQRGGSWAKLFTMLQGQPVKYVRIITNAMRNLKYGRGSKVRNAKRIAFAWILTPLLYNILANQLVDEKYKASGKELAIRSFLGPITYIPMIGSIGQTIIDRSFGDRFNYAASAAFSFVGDIVKAVDNFTMDDFIDGVTYLVDAMGKLKGVPTTIVTKPIRKAAKEEKKETGAPASF